MAVTGTLEMERNGVGEKEHCVWCEAVMMPMCCDSTEHACLKL